MRRAIPLILSLVACSPGNPVPGPRVAVPIAGTEERLTKVDMLFVIDDSPGTSPKQAELRARFPALITILDGLAQTGSPASYHVGVIGTDLGAGGYIDTNCKPGGLGGRLQRVGREAAVGCQGPSDNFIVYDQIAGTSNLPTGKTLAETFGCMASVGDNGCGFEQVLESAWRALHDDLPENRGFRRDDALLVVFFLTDEDDCSADDDSDVFSAPAVAPPDGIGYRRSYRCTRFGVAFDGPNGPELMPYGSTNGPVRNPRPARISEGAKLIEVENYIRAFTAPRESGGLLVDPSRLVFGSLIGPPEPVESMLANPNTGLSLTECMPPVSESCQPVLNQSCVNGAFMADPAVRIAALVNAVPSSRRVQDSVCASSYQRPLERLGEQIGVGLSGVRCFDGVLADPAHADCVVEDMTGGVPTALPDCATDDTRACWRLTTRAPNECQGMCARDGDPAQRYAIEIVRPAPAASGTTTRASCRLTSPPTPAPACTE